MRDLRRLHLPRRHTGRQADGGAGAAVGLDARRWGRLVGFVGCAATRSQQHVRAVVIISAGHDVSTGVVVQGEERPGRVPDAGRFVL